MNRYIIAQSHTQARRWARAQGLEFRDWTFIMRPDQLRGVSEHAKLDVLPNWHLDKNKELRTQLAETIAERVKMDKDAVTFH